MIELYNDDCINVLRNLPDNSVDLIVTDPPYDIKSTKTGSNSDFSISFQKSLTELDELDIVGGFDTEEVLNELVRVNKNINMYFWCNKAQIQMYLDYFVRDLDCSFDILKWVKTNAVPTFNNKYLSDTEYCLYFRKGGYCNPSNYNDASTLFNEPINSKDKKLYEHPTIKPVKMLDRLIKNSSKEGDVVLDCFMGSGSTGVSAKQLGRSFIGVELTEKYYEIAKKRIDNTISNEEMNDW